MATKKKKSAEDIVKNIPVIDTETKSSEIKQLEWPIIAKGTHLTVYTYEDGSTKLEWNDGALLDDVRRAIQEWEAVQAKPAKEKAKRKSRT